MREPVRTLHRFSFGTLWMRRPVRILAVLLLLLVAAPASSQPPADTLIVPGVRIGKATLTMTVDALITMLGEPKTWYEGFPGIRARTQPGVLVFDWIGTHGLRVATRDDREALAITTCGTQKYQTATGLKYNAPWASLERAYGKPTVAIVIGPHRLAIFDHLGLAVTLGFSSSSSREWVECITVFRPENARRIWKF